jgi:hypothetical protein
MNPRRTLPQLGLKESWAGGRHNKHSVRAHRGEGKRDVVSENVQRDGDPDVINRLEGLESTPTAERSILRDPTQLNRAVSRKGGPDRG